MSIARGTHWAGGHFSAAHRGTDGRIHGHTWRVRACWNYDGTDILVRQAQLREALQFLDHQELPDEISRAEDIAADLCRALSAIRVEVWREAEDLGAIWP